MYSKWAGGYDVVPDHRAVHAAADRRMLVHLREAIEETPLSRLVDRELPKEDCGLDGLITALQDQLRHGLALRWTEVLATERVLAEIAAEFDGQDPLKPGYRDALNKTKATRRWRRSACTTTTRPSS